MTLHYRNHELYIENVKLKSIAEKFGTPCYVYSRAVLETNWQTFDQSFRSVPHRICYAVKANSNITILHLLAKLKSSFDIVSLGELERVIAAGGDPKNIIFSGVGKSPLEIESAIERGIYCFNVESEAELERLNDIAARLKKVINIAFRINPDIDPRTHEFISTGLSENKFGIDMYDIIPLCRKLSSLSSLRLIGLASHIGSQIVELNPFLLNIDCLLGLYHQLREIGIMLSHINIGGGLGITYREEQPPAIFEYAKALQTKISAYPLEVILEPGRAIIGNAGILLTRVEYLKSHREKNFAIVDAGMNDILRPALYNAWQDIIPVSLRDRETKCYDIAGPVCESADFLGKDRELAIEEGDLLAIDSAGAYGFSMSSNYNSRCRPPEILIEGSHATLIRRRETVGELYASETLFDPLRIE